MRPLDARTPPAYEKSFRSNDRGIDQSDAREIDPQRNLRCAKHQAGPPRVRPRMLFRTAMTRKTQRGPQLLQRQRERERERQVLCTEKRMRAKQETRQHQADIKNDRCGDRIAASRPACRRRIAAATPRRSFPLSSERFTTRHSRASTRCDDDRSLSVRNT